MHQRKESNGWRSSRNPFDRAKRGRKKGDKRLEGGNRGILGNGKCKCIHIFVCVTQKCVFVCGVISYAYLLLSKWGLSLSSCSFVNCGKRRESGLHTMNQTPSLCSMFLLFIHSLFLNSSRYTKSNFLFFNI